MKNFINSKFAMFLMGFVVSAIISSVYQTNPLATLIITESTLYGLSFIPLPQGVYFKMTVGAPSLQLKQERKQHKEEMKTLADDIATRKLAADSDEQKRFDALSEELLKFNSEIEATEKREKFLAESAASGLPASTENEDKELRSFSFTKMVKEARKGQLTGFELEMHQEGEKEQRDASIPVDSRAFAIPAKVLQVTRSEYLKPQKRSLVAAGNFAIPTEKYGFFEALRDRQVLQGLGATYLLNLAYNLGLPGFTAGATAVWEAENVTSTESTPTIGGPAPAPHRLTAFTDVSWLLKLQANTSIEQMVINDLLNAAAQKWQAGAISGTGSSNQPTGLLNLSGTNAVVGGTNGAAPTLAHILALETGVETANAEMGSIGYLTNGKVRGKLKNTFPNSGSQIPVWPTSGTQEVNGYQAAVSNCVPSNLTKGTADSVCSAIIYGNWNDLIMCQYGGLNITFDNVTKAKNALDELVLNMWVDVVARRPESFSVMKDVLTT
jgi:HK97 family phage major capsid protein